VDHTSEHPDIFVIGGGPAGLAVAIEARRRGFTVTVADGDRPPIDKPCGEGLMPDGLAALCQLGVTIDPGEGRPFRGIRFIERGVSVEADFPEGHGLGIRRTSLHRAMIDHAGRVGVRMLWGACVEGISGISFSLSGPTSGDKLKLMPQVRVGGRDVPCQWIVGADGASSRVRRWAGLNARARDDCRFGFRQHYRVAPWSEWMELYWGERCQIYVTPVAADEVCVAVISHDRRFRLASALAQFPELHRRLEGAASTTGERGAVTALRRLRSVYCGRVALAGDASGSVDAITGEGLSIAFRQGVALVRSLESGDLARYQVEHSRIARRPSCMAHVLLTMGRNARIRNLAMLAMAWKPWIFARMLALHVGKPGTGYVFPVL